MHYVFNRFRRFAAPVLTPFSRSVPVTRTSSHQSVLWTFILTPPEEKEKMRAIVAAAAIQCAFGFSWTAVAKDIEHTLDEEFAAVKDTLTRTRAALQQFSWNMHTVVSLKGQVKKVSDHLCRYGPDGTVY